MKSKLLIKLGAPVLALSLIAACGMGNDEAPVEEDAPLNPTEENGDIQDDMQQDNNLDGAPNEEAPNDDLRDEDR